MNLQDYPYKQYLYRCQNAVTPHECVLYFDEQPGLCPHCNAPLHKRRSSENQQEEI